MLFLCPFIALLHIVFAYGCCNGLSHAAGTGIINVKAPGVYEINATVTVTATAAGAIGVQLYNGADAVPGAAASQTAAAAGVVTLPISKLIRVRPSCAAVGNAANLSLQLTGGAGTVTSVNVAIHQIA
ncbi:MAG: hypothetical protein Q3982_04465 [Phoenicibacter congonensis]|uniref:Uncharacterized protein n=1 Tax=Phoenicibacter congonensis TaxID=1944646 RepID=A0AA43RHH2_9ACTN|nr:hypothetical protein [Phoenicibacter congonensis]